MSTFSIVTNVSSLIAQENLQKTNALQATTITRLTSGLRINSSADDAAGLAIANRFRSDISVLRQGIRNGADGLSTLQTIDGGLNNVALLLDRARTLATQSASGTFIGDRNTLNLEFQSTIAEIDRQTQAIGLDPGGAFNHLLNVFIGGGRTNGSIAEFANGSVDIDLSNSAVNSNTLGLKGVQASGVAGTNIGASSATSVQAIVEDATNLNSLANAGFTEFHFRSPGFSDDGTAVLSVNLAGVVDTSTLRTAINAAIEGFDSSSAEAQAFKNAGITALVNTDSDGNQQRAFSSSDTAFQVSAGDQLANALLGNVTTSSNPTGLSLGKTVTGGAQADVTLAAVQTTKVVIRGGGLTSDVELSISSAIADTEDIIFQDLQDALIANTTLSSLGFSVAQNGGAVEFTNDQGENFQVKVTGDNTDALGFGSAALGGGVFGVGTDSTYNTISGSAAVSANLAGTATLSILVDGEATAQQIVLTATATTTAAELINQFNDAINAHSVLSQTGLQASIGGSSELVLETTTSGDNTNFTISVDDDATNNLLSLNDTAFGISTGTVAEGSTAEHTFLSEGAQVTSGLTSADPIAFTGITFGGDEQSLNLTAKDDNDAVHSLSISLTNANAQTIDEAVNAINTQIQASKDSTLSQVVAVKERDGAGTEGIRFISTLTAGFEVGIGDISSDKGLANATADSKLLKSAQLGSASIAYIASEENASKAVQLLETAVARLGITQATVGRGQNQLQFGISLATTQITNLSAAESRIRDADLALEAANLTRAGIAQQAGVAALAQANSAPQAVLALLRG